MQTMMHKKIGDHKTKQHVKLRQIMFWLKSLTCIDCRFAQWYQHEIH